MKYQIFNEKKGIHVKLDKDTHSKLRAKMFTHGLSMQETIEAFCRMLVDDDTKANKILQNIINKKVRAQIEGVAAKVSVPQTMSELDSDALYSLISEDAESQGTNVEK